MAVQNIKTTLVLRSGIR